MKRKRIFDGGNQRDVDEYIRARIGHGIEYGHYIISKYRIHGGRLPPGAYIILRSVDDEIEELEYMAHRPPVGYDYRAARRFVASFMGRLHDMHNDLREAFNLWAHRLNYESD